VAGEATQMSNSGLDVVRLTSLALKPDPLASGAEITFPGCEIVCLQQLAAVLTRLLKPDEEEQLGGYKEPFRAHSLLATFEKCRFIPQSLRMFYSLHGCMLITRAVPDRAVLNMVYLKDDLCQRIRVLMPEKGEEKSDLIFVPLSAVPFVISSALGDDLLLPQILLGIVADPAVIWDTVPSQDLTDGVSVIDSGKSFFSPYETSMLTSVYGSPSHPTQSSSLPRSASSGSPIFEKCRALARHWVIGFRIPAQGGSFKSHSCTASRCACYRSAVFYLEHRFKRWHQGGSQDASAQRALGGRQCLAPFIFRLVNMNCLPCLEFCS